MAATPAHKDALYTMCTACYVSLIYLLPMFVGLEKSARQGICRLILLEQISDSSHQLRSALVQGDTWQAACDSSPPWWGVSRFLLLIA